MDIFNHRRRPCRETIVGGRVKIGGDNPIVVQSMTSTATTDIPGSVAQIQRIVAAGAPLVRLTTQGLLQVEALGKIRSQVDVPLAADIHFAPQAALAAAKVTDKVRINPGNFVRPGEDFRPKLALLIDELKAHQGALRIGVNHGSLSPDIMQEYGDTPEGMVESAMRYVRECHRLGFDNLVVSIKASNTVVMVATVRLLAKTMADEGLNYPLHLGVTEAGAGEDGRVRSAIGIGTLLYQGIGDTIRVSLSEDPECEVPVAQALISHIHHKAAESQHYPADYAPGFNPLRPERLLSREVGGVGGHRPPVVVGLDRIDAPLVRITAEHLAMYEPEPDEVIVIVGDMAEMQYYRHDLLRRGFDNPVIFTVAYNPNDPDKVVKAAADAGTLLLNGMQDGIELYAHGHDREADFNLALNILQGARLRFSRTEFISCPSCGRTMFDIQSVVAQVKAATGHLKGLKIAVMGCIVNGPGEMADADYGYVGAAASRVSLYRRRECVEKNIPQEEAIDRLIALIKDNGEWTEA